ncbi:hypothetical protein F9U64_01205 [Gracilibacillus oryzae]|uniref:Uncharacterized protein n=1 Tax=Gracilibacillus oryzae TaxID=1672701 RepID=A0A7C8GW57_9BACI|nr:hypothetical protein [Gracilibacillus oryzae]KAB8139271.1 hypothetical protein F9U64_01205 [Gracilibacillus oryzae]
MLVHNKGKYVRHRKNVAIIPGVNDISERDWDTFKSHPLNKTLVDKGEIVVVKNEEDQEGAGGKITDLNASQAIELVQDTFSIQVLEALKEDEDRKTVIDAIDKQIKVIREGESDNEE